MNSSRLLESGNRKDIDWTGIIILIGCSLASIILAKLVSADSSFAMQLAYALAMTAVIAVVIWQACDPFAEACAMGWSSLSNSRIRSSATLDAIASSMPELFSGIFFVVVAITVTDAATDMSNRLIETTEGFASSIAICAGSSIYNLVLIPAICAMAISSSRPSKPQIEFEMEVINRDGAWVILSQLGLLLMLFMPKLYWWMALIGLAAYVAYIAQLVRATRSWQKENETADDDELPAGTPLLFGVFQLRFNSLTVLLTLLICTATAATACYVLVELTNYSAAAIGVPPFFVAVILAAAASSIPDTFMSLGAARRGDDSGAISNVFGSNIFDILVGMSIPLLVCCYINDWQPLELIGDNQETIQGVAGLRVLLFLLTSIVMLMLWRRRVITRRMGLFFCSLYLIFVAYAVIQAM